MLCHYFPLVPASYLPRLSNYPLVSCFKRSQYAVYKVFVGSDEAKSLNAFRASKSGAFWIKASVSSPSTFSSWMLITGGGPANVTSIGGICPLAKCCHRLGSGKG